jgi:serine/threonine-protein kinase
VGEWDACCTTCGLVPGLSDWSIDLMAGLFLDERYLVERRIGADGMTLVFEATDIETGMSVVIKGLNPDRALDPAVCDAFTRETGAARSLEIPGVARILDVRDATSDWQVPYLVQELIEGENLADLLERDLALDLPHALETARLTALTLDMIHSGGLVHRHLRPAKVIVPDLILDLGFGSVSPSDVTIHGSPDRVERYMSPEQPARVDASADAYSLGVLLLEMIGGNEAPSLVDAGATPEEIHHLLPGLPADLATLVSGMLAADPDARPRAGQIASSLGEALASLPAGSPHRRLASSAPPPPPSRPSLPPGRRIGKGRQTPAIQPPPPAQGIRLETPRVPEPPERRTASALSTVPPAARPGRRLRAVAAVAALSVVLVVLAGLATLGAVTFLFDEDEPIPAAASNPQVLAPPLVLPEVPIPEEPSPVAEPEAEEPPAEPTVKTRPQHKDRKKNKKGWELLD